MRTGWSSQSADYIDSPTFHANHSTLTIFEYLPICPAESNVTKAQKAFFIFAPDTKITSHPVKFGSGDWTAVIGVMEGTFSQPIPLGNGKSVPPTGKKFKLSMATIGHWKGGKMIEEYLFWDNQTLMNQIGLGNQK